MERPVDNREHGAFWEGCAVLLCSDKDRARLNDLIALGGQVVGWVDGNYRVLMGEERG